MRVALSLLTGLLITSSLSAAGTWQVTTSLPVSKAQNFAVKWNGSVYVVGGAPWRNGNDYDGSVFKLQNGAWVEVEPLTGMGPIVDQVGGVDDLNRVVVFGGHDSMNGDIGSARSYTPTDGTDGEINEPINLPFDRVATAVDNLNRVYRMGGGPGPIGFNYGHVLRYTGSTDSWEQLAYLPYTRASVATTYDGQGHIWGFGGYTSFGLPRLYDTIRYTIATNTWESIGVSYLPVQTSNAKAVLGADGKIYVIGGLIGSTATGTSTASVWVLNNPGGVNPVPVVAGPPLNMARHDFAAVLGDDKFIYVIGGSSTVGDASKSVERLYTGVCPSVGSQSPSTTLDAGATLTLTAAAAGDAPLTFQWKRNGVALVNGPTPNGSTIGGATLTTLTISNIAAEDAGSYTFSATNPCSTATGAAISVTVNAFEPADYNHDGHVNGSDLAQLLGAWGTANATIDLNGDGTINGADLAVLLGAWG
ncbi:MAG: immunoglobulin domain-containing protein [Phycisphaerae bacterium]|nr:immunoglobulin domain-containing protein [Phycisphaerae bacterium]